MIQYHIFVFSSLLVLFGLFVVLILDESFCEQSTHFAIAFEVPGGWHKEKEAITLTVLQVLLFALAC